MAKLNTGSFLGVGVTWSVRKVASEDQPTRCSGRINVGDTTLSLSGFIKWCGSDSWTRDQVGALFQRLGVPVKYMTIDAQVGDGERARRGGKSHHGSVPRIPPRAAATLRAARDAITEGDEGDEKRPRQVGSGDSEVNSSKSLIVDAYIRFTPQQRRVILRRHNQLSNDFSTWLRDVGATQIRVEDQAVDIRCVYYNQSYLFELKTCYQQSTRHAVREALGQALEYSYYPGRFRPDHLAILLDAAPSADDIAWIHHLASDGITIGLFWLVDNHVQAASVPRNPLARRASTGNG